MFRIYCLMENEKIIELKNLVFSYGNFKAIDNVTLDIGKGIYGLLGPNGAGKTTLMKLILGFLIPSSGSGTVLGYDIADSPLEVRKRIGYMPESDCLMPGMDAVGLTAYLGELSGMPRQEAIKRAHEVLYYVGLDESRYRKVETYSTGMKQRMKLAAALVHDPELLFLDEPTSGMDPQGRKEMLELINDIAAKGTMNIILSSHILADVEAACKHVLIMNKGKIISEQEISTALNMAALNIIELKLKGDPATFKEKLSAYKMEQDDKGVYRIHLPAEFPLQSLFKLAYDSKVQIRHFRKSKVTLEDAFVTAIGEGATHAH
jgi:ABC-2 type transport system ATP-binding protein